MAFSICKVYLLSRGSQGAITISISNYINKLPVGFMAANQSGHTLSSSSVGAPPPR